MKSERKTSRCTAAASAIIALLALSAAWGCNSEPESPALEETAQESVSNSPVQEQQQPTTLAEQLLGKWKLVASSEDKSTATGIPSFIEWETVEFRSNGMKYTTYKHTGSTETYTADNRYDVSGATLTTHGTVMSVDMQIIFIGDLLELRSGVSFTRYERVN